MTAKISIEKRLMNRSADLKFDNRRLEEEKAELIAILRKLQKKTYHYPDSDYHEYCNGCGRSPHNVPSHGAECLVVEVNTVLNKHKER